MTNPASRPRARARYAASYAVSVSRQLPCLGGGLDHGMGERSDDSGSITLCWYDRPHEHPHLASRPAGRPARVEHTQAAEAAGPTRRPSATSSPDAPRAWTSTRLPACPRRSTLRLAPFGRAIPTRQTPGSPRQGPPARPGAASWSSSSAGAGPRVRHGLGAGDTATVSRCYLDTNFLYTHLRSKPASAQTRRVLAAVGSSRGGERWRSDQRARPRRARLRLILAWLRDDGVEDPLQISGRAAGNNAHGRRPPFRNVEGSRLAVP